jgi:hypothetical protein
MVDMSSPRHHKKNRAGVAAGPVASETASSDQNEKRAPMFTPKYDTASSAVSPSYFGL